MSGAEGVLAVNIGAASLFAAGYAIFALANRTHRAALWFSVSYLLGMLSPIGDLLSPMIRQPVLMEWFSYATFLIATLSISATFSLFHGRAPAWRPILAILATGLVLRAAIGIDPRDSLGYGLAYQLPFALAAAQAIRTVLAIDRHRPLHLALAGVFAVIAVNFATKPFLALAFGAGRTLSDYTQTTYALISQASTGILLLAAGLVLLLIVAQKAILESQLASEVDPLSGVFNRRGFDRLAQDAMARAIQAGRPLSVAVFDLDLFKRINDTFGHAVGDAVIAGFAARLRELAPATAIGRMGGEEFAVLFENLSAEEAGLCAEGVRRLPRGAAASDLPVFTVSGGVAQLRRGESFADLMRRADAASYRAKNGGRDRICQSTIGCTPSVEGTFQLDTVATRRAHP
jgi:diguanylate cyclase (GGDEF)-like protein